jgi:large subunit ribosomal protein L25
MLKDNIVVEVERRHETGKNAANRLRASDLIPAVMYGGGKGMESLALAVPRKSLVNLLNKGYSGNSIFQLKLKGTDQQRHVMIRDLTLDPVNRALIHVDFVRVLMDKKLRVKVPVRVTGTSAGVKAGGLLDVVTHELRIESLPGDIPNDIPVDVTSLEVHQSLRVSDLQLGDKLKVLEPADRVIVHIGVPKAEEVTAAAATEVVATGAEPVVNKTGKKEEDGAAAAADKTGEKKPAEKMEKKYSTPSSSWWRASATPATGTRARGTTSASR